MIPGDEEMAGANQEIRNAGIGALALIAGALLFSSADLLLAQNPVEAAAASHGFVIGVIQKDGKTEPVSFASGVFISDRHVVTQLNKCCSAGQGVQIKGYVASSHGQNAMAQPIWSAKDKVIAVFEVEKPVGTAAALAPLKTLQQNQPVFAFGLKDGKPIPVEGTIAGVVTLKDSTIKLIQTKLAAEVHQGSGLYDHCGSVVGIILGAGQGGDILALPVDELTDAIAASKTNPQVAGTACAGSAGTRESKQGPGPGPGPGQKTAQRPPAGPQVTQGDTLKYTLLVVVVLLVIAFASKRGRQEVAKVMTSRRETPVAGLQQPMIQPPGQYPGQFQGQYMPGQMQMAPPGYYPPGTRPQLRGVNGYYAGSVVDLENNAWVLGRDARIANIVFPAATETVSKKHCTISFDPSRRMFVLEDNGSTNGTWLPSGESLAAGRPRDLYPGERFCVGDMNNIFEVVLE